MTARGRLIAIGIVMILAASLAAILFRPLREATGFQLLDPGEARAAEAMFTAALARPAATNWRGSARRFGLTPVSAAGNWPGIVLAEAGDDCRGRGAYLLRQPQPPEPVPYQLAITAPHRGSDRFTGTIAAQLFTEHNFAAAAWNSAPRRSTKDCPGGGDLARSDAHLFTAFAVAFAETYPEGRIVQLHGFERGKRGSARASEADIIISDGTEQPDDRLLDLADCLSIALHPRKVLVYPLEAAELGALANAQGRAVRAAGYAGFTHLEMAAELRHELASDKVLRDKLAGCLAGSQG